MRDPFHEYPPRLPGRSAAPVFWYRRLSGWYALHGGAPQGAALDVVESLEDGALLVCRGTPPAGAGRTGPVYAREPDGPPAVPTGRVLVRLREGEPVSDRRDALAALGFDIHETLPYAPHAAWLRTPDGDILAALRGLDALSALPGVENVEPQMLSAAARRA